MDDTNALLTHASFAKAVQFIWREAELLDRKNYRAWLDLWSPSGFYVVPIDPDAKDFAATLNYAYDDQHMRELRVQRLTSGYSPSVTDAARTVRTVSRFTVASEEADMIDVHSAQVIVAYKARRGDLVRGRRRASPFADGRRTADRAEGGAADRFQPTHSMPSASCSESRASADTLTLHRTNKRSA